MQGRPDLYGEDQTIPFYKKLYYNFSVEDGNNNIIFIKREINVIDNDKPVILDFSPKTATTGDIFNASAFVEDNIFLSDVTIEYWFDIEHFENNMKLANGNYSENIQIPDNATDLTYKISVTDTSGNNHSIEKTIEVIDNDKPVIKDYSYKTDKNYNR